MSDTLEAIRNALRRQVGAREIGPLERFGMGAPTAGPQTLNEANFSGSERVAQALRGVLGSGPIAERTIGAVSPIAAALTTDVYDDAQRVAQGGNPAMLAMALMPGAKGAGKVAQAGENAAAKAIRAYHGSPHDFDRFDMSKIGTGEGAQAYGHGLYFAENEGVARNYRDSLSAAPSAYLADKKIHQSSKAKAFGAKSGDGLDIQQTGILNELNSKFMNNPDVTVPQLISDELSSIAAQRARILSEEKNWLTEQTLAQLQRREDALKMFSDNGLRFDRPGHMYEVNINADPADFLDWDKPLSEQSEKIREALTKQGFSENRRGLGVMGALENMARDRVPVEKEGEIKKLVAGFMKDELGIPGIKYLDQGSRTAGEGSRNYVVFDDSLIEILRKYGLMPPAAAGVGAAAYGHGNEQ